ncbi:MAG: T9SS type A sorting domain-containing protein [Bacteroidales bacterium]
MDDRVYDAIELDNGDFIVTGKSTNGSFEKLWLYKLDSSGVLVDSLIISGQNGLGRISRLTQVAEDTIVGIGDKPDEISGLCELFYIRINTSFSYYEEKTYPVGNYVDCRFRTKADGDSKLVVFGYLIDRVNPYDIDMAYFSLDVSGNMLKQKIYDDENMRIIFDLLVKGGEEYYAFVTEQHMAMYKLDENFIVLDTVEYTDYLFNMSALWYDDTSIVTTSTRLEDKTPRDLHLSLYDTLGNQLEDYVYGKPNIKEYCYSYKSIDYFDKNNIYITATSNFTVGSLYQEYDNEVLVVNLDSTLTPRWEKYIGGDAYYNVFNLTALQDGGVVLACRRHDYREHVGEMDVCLFRLDAEGNLMASTELHPHSSGFEIYPNPVHDRLYINGLRTYRDAEVKVYNASGQLMLQEKLHEDYLDVASLPKGFYLLKIHSEDEIFVQKFVRK